jgi:hypothetical protein
MKETFGFDNIELEDLEEIKTKKKGDESNGTARG